MFATNCPAAVLTRIVFVPLVLSWLEADAQSAVDYSKSSCSSCALSEVARLIREEIGDVKNLIVANQLSAVEASKQALVSAFARESTL